MKTIKELSDILIDYIENNKVKNEIDYENSIETLQELLNEIKTEYKNLGDEENER